MSTASERKKTSGTLIIHLDNRCGRLYVNQIEGRNLVFNRVMKHMV